MKLMRLDAVTVEYLDSGAVFIFCKHFLMDGFYLRAPFFICIKPVLHSNQV